MEQRAVPDIIPEMLNLCGYWKLLSLNRLRGSRGVSFCIAITFSLKLMISNYRSQRSWAKVIFSQAPRDQADPPGPGRPPLDQADPPGPGRPPRTRQTPPSPPDQADDPPRPDRPPQTRQTPPDQTDPPRPGRPPWTRQTPPDQADTPHPTPRLQHMVYERPVRILLECILVRITMVFP